MIRFIKKLFQNRPDLEVTPTPQIGLTEDLEALRQRNAQRLEEAKNRMGTKYNLHPDNGKNLFRRNQHV